MLETNLAATITGSQTMTFLAHSCFQSTLIGFLPWYFIALVGFDAIYGIDNGIVFGFLFCVVIVGAVPLSLVNSRLMAPLFACLLEKHPVLAYTTCIIAFGSVFVLSQFAVHLIEYVSPLLVQVLILQYYLGLFLIPPMCFGCCYALVMTSRDAPRGFL
jgi:hypothetical protein